MAPSTSRAEPRNGRGVDEARPVLQALLAVVVASLVAGCGGSNSGKDLSDGAKMDMGGWSLYIQCKGTGSPTVVLDAGLHDSHTTWEPVEPAVARRTQTCSYDRSGLGKSDVRPSRPEVVPAEQVVDELRDLLASADVPPPYVLVGHSIAGFHARVFAARHVQDVAGIVFVDPTRPEYFGRAQSPPELAGAAISYRTAYEVGRSVQFGEVPAVVIVSWEERASTATEARELAMRSSNGMAVLTRTGHGIHWEKPKLVVEAINLVVDSARSQTAILPCRKTRLTQLGGECLQ
jgi:pimeloyl-ACP methyl ester carboxylesterase